MIWALRGQPGWGQHRGPSSSCQRWQVRRHGSNSREQHTACEARKRGNKARSTEKSHDFKRRPGKIYTVAGCPFRGSNRPWQALTGQERAESAIVLIRSSQGGQTPGSPPLCAPTCSKRAHSMQLALASRSSGRSLSASLAVSRFGTEGWGGGGPKAMGMCGGGAGESSWRKSGRSQRRVRGRRTHGGARSMCANTRRWKAKEASLRRRGPT